MALLRQPLPHGPGTVALVRIWLEFHRSNAYLSPAEHRQDTQMAGTNPLQFAQQVRAEIAKVVWPTRREVLLTTVMVVAMAALTAIFFSLVDLAIRSGLEAVVGAFN